MLTIKTSFRSLWKKKTFSVLNIAGLSVGIASSLLIFLVIRNETSYNGYNSNADRIYRVTGYSTLRSNGELKEYLSGVPHPLPDAMRRDFPQLEKSAGVWGLGQAQIYVPTKNMAEEKRFKETQGIFWTEPELYELFDFTWLAGNASEMKEPNTVVLSKTNADKFFGSPANAMNKTIQMWSFRIPLRVVGVYKDLPGNTDLPIRMGGSAATLRKLIGEESFTTQEAWYGTNGNLQYYIQLPKNQPLASLQAQLPSFVKRHYNEANNGKNTFEHLLLIPVTKIHLDERFELFNNNRISIKELWALALIGLFLLVIACINFINLSTAQSLNRAKEIGVRKVLGSNRAQLVKQFLQETALVTLLSIVIACLLAWISLPLLNGIMNKSLSFSLLRLDVLAFIVGMGVVVTFLAGFYPAIVLSGFTPATIFKNKINVKVMGGLSLRRGLVVFQFIIAQLLIIGTIVVLKQMDYFRSQPMGFDKEGIVIINLPSDSSLKVKYPTLIRQVSAVPGVTATSLCMESPSNFWSWTTEFYFNNNPMKTSFEITRQLADTGYYKTFGLTLVAGRLPFHSDSTNELILNETAVKKLGIANVNDIINKTISFDGNRQYPIVGVIKDFHSKSLREAIAPMIISQEYNVYEWIAVRMNTHNMSTTLPRVQKVFTALYPTYIYDQVFYDKRLEGFYTSEAVTAQLFKLFAFLAIFISCLGLYGLVSFMAIQKTKEVGIRKVLGASVQNIVYLFSKEFTILIVLAFCIAAPTAWYFMHLWLSGFYYHTTIGWEVFVLAIVCSVIIAWITVGYRAVRAAMVNPVKSLKSE